MVTNLIIISKIKKGERLMTRNEFFNIDTRSFQFFFRWKESENRSSLLQRLEDTINMGIDYTLWQHFQQCVVGLENLQATYSMDIQTISRLQVIIDKINFSLEKNKVEII